MQPLKNRGIVLVTTLLVTVLVVMLVTAVVYTGAGGLALTGNFYEREAALLAADSGLQYAMARLQANPTWRGDDPSTAPADSPNFSVVERNGNVFGFLSTPHGHRSQFRIKFNYEDGPDGLDGLGNTQQSEFLLPTALVSINNLLGATSVPATRANPDGQGPAGGQPPYTVPRATACIMVEGLAGWGLRDADTSKPNDFSANRTVTRRVIEAYLAVDNTAGVDAAAYAGGDLKAVLAEGGRFSVSSKDGDVAPRVRSLASVLVSSQAGTAAYDDGASGQVVVGQDGNFLVNGSTPADANVDIANSSDLFKRLTWESIAKARPNSSDAQMQAGTYVWRLDSQTGEPYLEYFARNYPEGTALPPAGQGASVATAISGSGVRVDQATLSILLTNNVYVNPLSNGGPAGLTIRMDDQVSGSGLRPVLGFIPPDGSQRASVLTSTGPILVQGAVLGTGAVTSEGSITFQGPSVLESDPDTGVSLYAKGDITLEAISGGVAGAQRSLVTEPEATPTTLKGAQHQGPGGRDDDRYEGEDDHGGPDNDHGGRGEPGGLETPHVQPPIDNGDPEAGDAIALPKGLQVAAIRASLKSSGIISSLEAFTARKETQLEKLERKFGELDYADQDLTGVIYTWGDFNARLRSSDTLNMTGTLIAFGGDPSSPVNSAPGTVAGKGRIDLEAGNVGLTYDPSYITDLMANINSIRVKRRLWATW